jgi:hypothetical protein
MLRTSLAARFSFVGFLLALLLGVLASGCKDRVSRAQCDELLGRFAELVVKEKMPNAAPDAVLEEQARERDEAARDDNFKNCTTELRVEEYRCAMAASAPETMLKCLE